MRHKAAIIPLVMAALLVTFSFPARSENREIITLPTGKAFLKYLGKDESSGATFWIYSRDQADRCWSFSGGKQWVFGIVPKNISLLDDVTVRDLLVKGGRLKVERCGRIVWIGRINTFDVFLTYEGWETGEYSYLPLTNIDGVPVFIDGSVEADGEKVLARGYRNYAKEIEEAKIKKRKIQEARERLIQFLVQNGVNSVVSLSDLMANPFIHKGKTVAYRLYFSRMISETQGLFSANTLGDYAVMVSGLPKNRFTQSGEQVSLVVKILGDNFQLNPLFTFPHLKFIAAYSCVENSCPAP